MKQYRPLLICASLIATLLGASVLKVAAQGSMPIVRAVLFYSSSCAQCEYVIHEVLPPLTTQYGPQLQIIGFDVSQERGAAMFNSAQHRYGIQDAAVPVLVIDNITLVSDEIQEQFPALVESYMKLGGVTWPEIPGLREMLVGAAQTSTAEAALPSTATAPAAPRTANYIAVALVLAALAAVVVAVLRFRSAARIALPAARVSAAPKPAPGPRRTAAGSKSRSRSR